MRERVMLVGQAPSRLGRPDRPLIGGRSGSFLMELTGMNLIQYARRFERRNLLRDFPGSAPIKGDLFPSKEAREAAARMIDTLRGRTVILVGRAVSEAFGLGAADFYEWSDDARGFRVAIIPHPSGINAHWNLPGSKAEAMGFFARLQREMP